MQTWPERTRHRGHMLMRVSGTLAIQADAHKAGEAEIGRLQSRVLTGPDQRWRQPLRGKRVSNWFKFDGFGPGPNDQANVGGTQPSP